MNDRILFTKNAENRKTKIPSNSDDAFQNFIKTCLERRSDKDTKKVLQKLNKLYDNLSSYHKTDNKFTLYINTCYKKIIKNIAKDIFTPILELRTEIKNRIKSKLKNKIMHDNEVIVEAQEISKENRIKIKQLEESIIQCRKKIKELEKQEVNFDDDENSSYIQQDKYKKRLIQLCHCLSKLKGDKAMKEQILKKKIRRKNIQGEMTGNLLLDQAIISAINSEIRKINRLQYLETKSCADFIKMPEYIDILQCIKKCNKNNDLGLSDEQIIKSAKASYQVVGKFLKQQRINELKLYMQFIIHGSEDPAKKDSELQNTLQQNKEKGDQKLYQVYQKYTDIQDNLRLEKTKDTAFKSKEPLKDNTATEKTLTSNDSKNSIKKKNFEKIDEIVKNEIIIIDSSDDECVVIENPKSSFIKVCAFAKSPPAWVDDRNLLNTIESPPLTVDKDVSNNLDIELY
ncbi:death domain-associated protein 6-like [Phymastichus coffea]|uniref:death domain-associated protein 6-like n=1 Tax=Phymastichus coffea TaxID=108790 RepID=UPI00273CF192|nr:death domain-associated protein 6-like [Phymastichus coffea]XP_058802939.1 death domain-associated protein 6-like [Phymastichus coffea]XP_058802940.1 death domain-associated protein 6-like [Phymastichus coffea]XP_058802941.1 death domain-associated protein 6-like [Phymastichus coffea]XP_058802942.1 death domain-associated protein 6-like [Phymastichus coffea]